MADIGDIVLIHREDQPAFFARIEDIWSDRKPGWYHVKLLMLQVPIVEAVWIMRGEYINGETFTMDGIAVRLEKVRGPGRKEMQSTESEKKSAPETYRSDNKVISLFDRKKE